MSFFSFGHYSTARLCPPQGDFAIILFCHAFRNNISERTGPSSYNSRYRIALTHTYRQFYALNKIISNDYEHSARHFDAGEGDPASFERIRAKGDEEEEEKPRGDKAYLRREPVLSVIP